MTMFKVEFTREVVTTDRVFREIEADSLEAAQKAADAMAWDFNGDCPDDAEACADVCGDWSREAVEPLN